MKVLMINSVCGRQSTGRIVSGIQEQLVAKGHECVVAYGESNSNAKKCDYHIGCEADRYIHALSTRVFDNTGFCSKVPTKRFVRFIQEYKPDIIHIHNLHGYYINIEILMVFLKQYGKPVVWTFHDCWPFTGHCAHFDLIKCYKWKNICHNCPQVNIYPKSIKDRSSKNYIIKKKLFDGIIPILKIVSPSEWLQDLVAQSFLKKADTCVIRNGIDIMVFKPRRSNLRAKYNLYDIKIILGVASVWDKRKGLEDFIRLSQKLEKGYIIVLIGLGGKELEMVEGLGIIGIKQTDNAIELAEWYSEAYIFFNPTYEDNFPTVNIEALACGTPVVTYNTGGSPECLDEGEECGAVVPQGDINKVVELIADNSFDRELCRLNGVLYNAVDKYGEYISLYYSLVER